jgi:hypothetical protein
MSILDLLPDDGFVTYQIVHQSRNERPTAQAPSRCVIVAKARPRRYDIMIAALADLPRRLKEIQEESHGQRLSYDPTNNYPLPNLFVATLGHRSEKSVV